MMKTKAYFTVLFFVVVAAMMPSRPATAQAAKPGSYFWLKGGDRPAQLPADHQATLR